VQTANVVVSIQQSNFNVQHFDEKINRFNVSAFSFVRALKVRISSSIPSVKPLLFSVETSIIFHLILQLQISKYLRSFYLDKISGF